LGIHDGHLINALQRLAVEESRLGIPLIVGNDVIHGFRTIFPIPLAESCTWDPALLERAAHAAAEEASACGTDWIFAPMVDIARDPRWGRIAEGAGEDPFLGAAMARARVRGFQAADLKSGRRIVACPKHYVAYGAAEAGRDYNTVDISERTLRDVYLPPFKAALDAGAGTIMSAFNEIAGVPSTINALTLRTILRDEWQWPGVVLSDYEAVRELIQHGVAADLKEAGRLSILAGLDMEMVSTAFADHLAELVAEGAVPEARVDEAVRRVLRLKIRLGLFERPYTDEALPAQIILCDEFRRLALEVARESMVLLKNERGLLPLVPGCQRLAVVGPLADARRDMLGTWTLFGREEDAETVLDGLRAHLGADAQLAYAPGCPIVGDGPADISAAVAAAEAADVVIAVVGEGANMSGEARSRMHLGLPGRQQELMDALAQAGKPLVAVLMTGRPLVIPRLAAQVDALLVAWHAGIRAGRAVADLLFGAANPSGKLTTSWPRAEGQIPIYYGHKNTGRPMEGEGTTQFIEPFKSRYIDGPNEPLFPFGFGLSYTTFAYRDLRVETPVVGLDGTVAVSAVVANTGSRPGVEVVQLYVRDLVGSVTRPVKELKGFQRVALDPGEERMVRFEVPVRELGFHGPDMKYRVEPGAFAVWIGPNSAEGLEGRFEVR
ncbi:MAG: glycoside hydrolase family 3 N-terminal domain-containing protein, partial [Anaerolineae bacterium]